MKDADDNGRHRAEAMQSRTGAGRSLAEIEQEIGRARAEIDLTIEALNRKLSVHYLIENGVDMMKYSISESEVWNQGLAVIRANPIPVALLGIGAAWLLVSTTGMAEAVARDEHARAAGHRVADMAADVGSRAAALASDAATRVGIGIAAVGEAVARSNGPIAGNGAAALGEGWVRQATGAVQGALRSACDSSGVALDRAKGYARQAGGQATRVTDQVVDTFERHPLLIGGVGIVLGALIGALLPGTRTEDRWVGATRDKLVEKAEETGHQAVVRLREAAEELPGKPVSD